MTDTNNIITKKTNASHKTVLKAHVARLFEQAIQPRGSSVENPITGQIFVWGEDPIEEQEQQALAALLAQEHFARYGPPDAPPLPLRYWERDKLKRWRGLPLMVKWYARSWECNGYDLHEHPPFDDYARGVLAAFDHGERITTEQRPEFVAELRDHYQPCPLPILGMGLVWYPPKTVARLKAEYPRIYGGLQ